ncbi:hypothetical protein UP10_31830 [Bradyrhizobium sp. LTSPM299]|nr:hypothetical protein UP10_31830 [Bradyrhizobium sp. LTSPM299]
MKPSVIVPPTTARLQARVRANHLRYQQLTTFTLVRGFAPGSRNSSQLLPWVGAKKLEAGTFPFVRFGIQVSDAFLTAILLRHGQLHHVAMYMFFDAFSVGRCTKLRRRRVRFPPVSVSLVENKGDETSHTAAARKR